MAMKQQKVRAEFQHRTRAHRVLFDRDLPFRPQVVDSKIRYRRRPKHQKPCTE
jgi:hypothetical protein